MLGEAWYVPLLYAVTYSAANARVQNLRASLQYAVHLDKAITVVRCPYCVSGDDFRPMSATGNGRFACYKCSHLAAPNDTHFRCVCPKCSELRLHSIR